MCLNWTMLRIALLFAILQTHVADTKGQDQSPSTNSKRPPISEIESDENSEQDVSIDDPARSEGKESVDPSVRLERKSKGAANQTSNDKSLIPSIADCDLHVVGIYMAKDSSKDDRVYVEIKKTERPVVVTLSAYGSTQWNLKIEPGAPLRLLIIAGYFEQELANPPPGVPIIYRTYFTSDDRDGTRKPASAEKTPREYFWASSWHTKEGRDLKRKLKEITGLDVKTFQSTYEGSTFVIDGVRGDLQSSDTKELSKKRPQALAPPAKLQRQFVPKRVVESQGDGREKSKLEGRYHQLGALLRTTNSELDEILKSTDVQRERVKIVESRLDVIRDALATVREEMWRERKNRPGSKDVEKVQVDSMQSDLIRVQQKLSAVNASEKSVVETNDDVKTETQFDEAFENTVGSEGAISISQLLRKHLETKLQTWEHDYREAEQAVLEAVAASMSEIADERSADRIKHARRQLRTLVERSFRAQLLVHECRLQLASIDLQILQAKQQRRRSLAEKIVYRRVMELIPGSRTSEQTPNQTNQQRHNEGNPVEGMLEISSGDSSGTTEDRGVIPIHESVVATTLPAQAFQDVLAGKPPLDLMPDIQMSSTPYATADESTEQAERRRSWTNEYVNEVNRYLTDALESEVSTEDWKRVVGSLDKLLLKWSASDQADFKRTGQLLTDFANRNGESPDESRRSLVHSSLYLRQVARTTGVIPRAIKNSAPTRESTTSKLNLLTTMLNRGADVVWIDQEQRNLAGLLDEAPFQVVRELVKEDRVPWPWLYALSSVKRASVSSRFQKVPPIDPVLLVVILRTVAGANEESGRNLSQLFSRMGFKEAFAQHVDDIMGGDTVYRTTVQRALAEILRETKSEELKARLIRLVPRIVVFAEGQQVDTDVLRDSSGGEIRMSNAKAIPRDEDSIFEALMDCQSISASGLHLNHNFPIGYRINLKLLARELKSISRQNRGLSVYLTSDHEKVRHLMLFAQNKDSAPELALQILNAIQVATVRPSSAQLVVPDQNVERVHGYKLIDSVDELESADYDSITIGQWKNDGQISFALRADCDRHRLAAAVEMWRIKGGRVLIMKSVNEKRVYLCCTESDAGELARVVVSATIPHNSDR